MDATHIQLLIEVRRALNLSRKELAALMGTSLRTVERMFAGHAYPSRAEYGLVVQAVYPTDPALAERIAVRTHTTLQELGIAPPAPPPSTPLQSTAASSVPPTPAPVSIHAIDSVLCAAADAVELPLSGVRPILRAAFVRASELGVSVEMMTAALVAPKPRERSGADGSNE